MPDTDLLLPSLRDTHVVVVGDVMLDRYWHGQAQRVSQEAPVPVVDVERVEDRPGGAANVALNIVSLGARCTLIGVVGDDDAGLALRGVLESAGVQCDFVVAPDYQTVVKLRVISQRQQLLRTDFEKPMPMVAEAVERKARDHLQGAAALVLEDYDKGTLSEPGSLVQAGREAGVKVLVDPKAKSLDAYRGAYIVKPNDHEFRALTGAWKDDDEFAASVERACRSLDLEALVVTRGSKGLIVAMADGSHEHVPANEVEVYDETGAGDTVISVLALGTAVGWAPPRSARLANLAASLVVAKLGTATVSGPELAYAAARKNRSDRGILSRAQLVEAVRRAAQAGERVVFTNGCFDILHAGHVTYLEEARTLGDRLVVAVNDDASVKRLKGATRPVNPLDRRLRVLSGLAAVDWVVGFEEDTPEPLLELLRPHVLVKGGDYAPDEVVGHEIVHGYGGEVRVLSLVDDLSTTGILEQLRQG